MSHLVVRVWYHLVVIRVIQHPRWCPLVSWHHPQPLHPHHWSLSTLMKSMSPPSRERLNIAAKSVPICSRFVTHCMNTWTHIWGRSPISVHRVGMRSHIRARYITTCATATPHSHVKNASLHSNIIVSRVTKSSAFPVNLSDTYAQTLITDPARMNLIIRSLWVTHTYSNHSSNNYVKSWKSISHRQQREFYN